MTAGRAENEFRSALCSMDSKLSSQTAFHIFATTALARGRFASPKLGRLYSREIRDTHFTGD